MSRPEGIRQGDIPGVQLRRRIALPVAPREAWSWLVSGDRLERWLATRARIGLQVGAIWELEALTPDGSPLAERLELLGFEAPRRLQAAFERRDAAWGMATLVELTVVARQAGCELSVLQSQFERLPFSIGLTAWEFYRRRWQAALQRLQKAVTAER